ncbi:MAG: PEP-CTERM sorting domain-containing protein [Myxococcota bacterium]
MKRLVPLLLALVLPSAAFAAPIESGVWLDLGSHPGGNQAPSAYGLRLDGLLTGDSGDVYTFDFDHEQSDMKLFWDEDANTIQITGQSWGGLDVGSVYENARLFTIDFTYQNVMDQTSRNRLQVNPAPSDSDHAALYTYGLSRGSITDTTTDTAYDLVDFAGNHGYTFRCVEEHRGAERSCYGWVNHSGAPGGLNEHLYASDWLFTVDHAAPVPEPSAALLFGLGAAVCGNAVRRRR